MTPELTHARARSAGPLPLGPGEPAPAGMLRAGLGDGTGTALPAWPDGATPSLLEEYQVAPTTVERSGETRRVLAAALRCCWTDLAADPWPGSPAPVDEVLSAYRALIGRGDDLMRNWAVGALRRLHDSAWLTVEAGVVRLGPRCASWPAESHAQLRELLRRLPSGTEGAVRPAVLPVLAGDGEAAREATDGPDGDAGEPREPEEVSAGGQVAAASEVIAAADLDADLLEAFDERRRAEIVAAFMAVEHAAEPVHEARFPALRDPAPRRTVAEMLRRRGRVLVQGRETWISGYADEVGAVVSGAVGEAERAVLTLVLVHSVAIPRAEGVLPADSWLSPFPAPVEELRRHTRLPVGALDAALRTLRHAGLVTQVKAGEEAGGYVPGPQFHRLTPAARRRLQEELILAAGPHTPLAAAIRANRRGREYQG
ncbi:helix-turn-helix domain-containing protein [Streptosporangium sp. NPDC048047]|uniref:helix-turn-helix domain-containing protein n=1 Tax=Streptosporangium sp. NPDC048047 TaxID=3155748 RepID=UPI003416F873